MKRTGLMFGCALDFFRFFIPFSRIIIISFISGNISLFFRWDSAVCFTEQTMDRCTRKRERDKESNGIQVMKHDLMECLPYFNNCKQYYCIKWYQKCGGYSQQEHGKSMKNVQCACAMLIPWFSWWSRWDFVIPRPQHPYSIRMEERILNNSPNINKHSHWSRSANWKKKDIWKWMKWIDAKKPMLSLLSNGFHQFRSAFMKLNQFICYE